jgi:hypothetical protein
MILRMECILDWDKLFWQVFSESHDYLSFGTALSLLRVQHVDQVLLKVTDAQINGHFYAS